MNNREKIVETLCVGLGDNWQARERLRHGVFYLIDQIESQSKPQARIASMNKYAIPVFAGLIYVNHRFDVPIEQYADELYAFMENALSLDEAGVMEPIIISTPDGEYKPGDKDYASVMLAGLSKDFLEGSEVLFK